MRRVLAAAVVVGLLTVGASAPAGADDSAVTKDKIKLGVSYVDLAAVRQAGINRDHGDYVKAYQTVIDDINAKGGINGRKIDPVFAAVNPIGTDPAQQACVKLTEDDKVFAVIGQFQADAPLCYVEQHTTPIVGGTITGENLKRAKAAWYTLEPSDPDVGLIVDALAKDGVFKKGKVGIIDAAQEKSVVDTVVMPALKKNKVTSTETAILNAPQGDIPAGQAEMDTVLERFKTDKVKTILAAGTTGVLTAQRLAKTDYRPRLASTNQAVITSYLNTAGSDKTVLKDAITGNPSYPYNDPTLAKCRDKVAAATNETMVETPAPGSPSYRTSAEVACRYVTLFAALAKAAGKNLTTASFAKAGQNAGSVDVPGSGTIAYNPKTHTFAQPVFLARYDPATQTFVTDAQPTGAKTSTGK